MNPKNLAVAVASAVVVASVGLPGPQQVVACAVLRGLAVLGVAAPLVVALGVGDRSQGVLESWRTGLVGSAAVMAVILLVFGVVLIGKGIAGL